MGPRTRAKESTTRTGERATIQEHCRQAQESRFLRESNEKTTRERPRNDQSMNIYHSH